MPLRSAGTGFDEEWPAVAAHRNGGDDTLREDISWKDRDEMHAVLYSYGPDDFSFDLTNSSSSISVLTDADPNPSIENEEATQSAVFAPSSATANRCRLLPTLLSVLCQRRLVCAGLSAIFILVLGASMKFTIGQNGIHATTSGSNNTPSIATGSDTPAPTASPSTIISGRGSSKDWQMNYAPSRYISLQSALVQLSGGDESHFLSTNNTAQHQSLVFLSESDPLRLSPDSPTLAQRYGLAVLYFATNGPNGWKNRGNWLTGHECEWYGVSCYRDGKTVDDLYLWRNGLNGMIPNEIGLLKGLRRLDLSDNSGLKGSTMSESFGLLDNLRVLHIENCGLVGPVPDTIFNLRYLEVLDAGSNNLSGSLPSFLGNLVSLEKLHLERNLLEKSLPTELGTLMLLNEIYLSENRFSGTIPSEMGNLIALKELSLYSNLLTGTIPKLSSEFLKVLYLDDNALEQSIPSWINESSELTDLRLQRNNFEGPIPDLSSLRRLQLLYLQENDLSGEFPHWLGYLNSLIEVQLFGNKRLTGTIHESISNLIELRVLHLNDCSLTGTLPRYFPPRLEHLNVGNNQLMGDIPSSMGNLKQMQKMTLHNCGFTGKLPSIGKLLKLQVLSLDGNFFTGTINEEIGSLKALTIARFSSNNFGGSIPSSLGSLSQLEELAVYANAFTGSMPPEICNLRDRGELDVLEADCDEVKCRCCSSCCTRGGACPEVLV